MNDIVSLFKISLFSITCQQKNRTISKIFERYGHKQIKTCLHITIYSRLSKNLIKYQSLWIARRSRICVSCGRDASNPCKMQESGGVNFFEIPLPGKHKLGFREKFSVMILRFWLWNFFLSPICIHLGVVFQKSSFSTFLAFCKSYNCPLPHVVFGNPSKWA